MKTYTERLQMKLGKLNQELVVLLSREMDYLRKLLFYASKLAKTRKERNRKDRAISRTASAFHAALSAEKKDNRRRQRETPPDPHPDPKPDAEDNGRPT